MNNIYRNYAVWTDKYGVDHLVKVLGGYFASEAFMKSDEEFAKVLGSKFGGIFGDKGDVATCDKRNIRRLTSKDEFQYLYKKSCEGFKWLVDKVMVAVEEQSKSLPLVEAAMLGCVDTLETAQRMHTIHPEWSVETVIDIIVKGNRRL